ncbi:Uncharacterised protein [Mycobacteroides abscessus subsp. abscessus]|nr:Uncharacterised protein [Mycobacteroides abscessus subsp. abscessus]
MALLVVVTARPPASTSMSIWALPSSAMDEARRSMSASSAVATVDVAA